MTGNNQRRLRAPSRGGGWAPWALAAVLVVAIAGGVLFALAASDDGEDGGVTTTEGVSHVHGLGVNPGDGELYAATHHGVFRIPGDGDAELVSVPRDTMGFTVVGADHFLGSGHPAFQGDPLFEQGTPPLLGLIESTDAGETWERLSLFGEVDFHALEAAHDLVYGFDATAGRFLVSADGTEWETRSEGLAMSDFAVDPASADHLVAMTSDGLAVSADGGRSWTRTDGPPVMFLAWHTEHGLWGITGDGDVFTRDATSWAPRGSLPGSPQALVVTDDAIFAAASDGDRTGIYGSTDGGRSWQLRYADDQ